MTEQTQNLTQREGETDEQFRQRREAAAAAATAAPATGSASEPHNMNTPGWSNAQPGDPNFKAEPRDIGVRRAPTPAPAVVEPAATATPTEPQR